MTTRYKVDGKIETPLTSEDFEFGMENGKFVQRGHREFCVLLFYTGVRVSEALRALRDQFQLTRTGINFDVGQRLKRGKKTPPLRIPFKASHVPELKEWIEQTRKGEKVFPWCRKTAYNIVRRAFKYPHLFRLSRITNFFLEGWDIARVRNWTGLTLAALEYYVGLADIEKMGESLAKQTAIDRSMCIKK